jgi:hypothetical protein
MGNSDIAARITLLGEFTGEEIVELCTENTVGDEFSSLADLGRHFREDGYTVVDEVDGYQSLIVCCPKTDMALQCSGYSDES